MDDVFVELCRSGALGPLVLGMTAPEVEDRIGKPDDIKWVHGASNWQRYSYPGVSLMLMCPTGDERHKRNLRLSRISIYFDEGPLILPKPIAQDTVQSAASLEMDDARRLLADHGIEMAYHDDTLSRDLEDAIVEIYGFDGFVSSIVAQWRRSDRA